jgi:hypothetical protein
LFPTTSRPTAMPTEPPVKWVLEKGLYASRSVNLITSIYCRD